MKELEKGKIEFDDPAFRPNPLSLDEKREQVRRGDPAAVRYGGKTKIAVIGAESATGQLQPIHQVYELRAENERLARELESTRKALDEVLEHYGATDSDTWQCEEQHICYGTGPNCRAAIYVAPNGEDNLPHGYDFARRVKAEMEKQNEK